MIEDLKSAKRANLDLCWRCERDFKHGELCISERGRPVCKKCALTNGVYSNFVSIFMRAGKPADLSKMSKKDRRRFEKSMAYVKRHCSGE